MKTSIDDAGRIELPKFVQAQLGVRPGNNLALEQENGKWFIMPLKPIVDTDDDDLNWNDLDYEVTPLRRAGQMAIRILRRGRLSPLPYDLDHATHEIALSSRSL